MGRDGYKGRVGPKGSQGPRGHPGNDGTKLLSLATLFCKCLATCLE